MNSLTWCVIMEIIQGLLMHIQVINEVSVYEQPYQGCYNGDNTRTAHAYSGN